MRSHSIALHVNGDDITYFDSFGVKNTLKEIKKFIGKKNILQTSGSMCGFFCLGFIDFMLQVKSLLDYTNLFSAKA